MEQRESTFGNVLGGLVAAYWVWFILFWVVTLLVVPLFD